jgi:hypothetical protein
MGPTDYHTHIHGPFESYTRFHNHHGFYHDRIFQDEERREYICRYCPCEIIGCSARFANSLSLTEHLWDYHTLDTKALKFYTHRYCDTEAGQGDQSGVGPRPPAELDSNSGAFFGKIKPVNDLESSAFNFDISQMLASGDKGSAGLGECKAAWIANFPPRTHEDRIRPIVTDLLLSHADNDGSSSAHGSDGKSSDDGPKQLVFTGFR